MCGQEINTRPINIQIEGAELLVCPSCSKHGKPVVKPAPQAKTYGGLKNSTDIRPQSK